jgi:hypothetical protein
MIFGVVLGQPAREAFKFDEGPVQGGCGEYGRLGSFMEEMMIRQKDARGLIIVFRGSNLDRFGNLLGYVSGAGGWVADHGVPANKISFVLAEGQTFAHEQYWIIPNGAEPPDFTSAHIDWKSLPAKYLFSTTCTGCEPSYPELGLSQPYYEGFAQVLRNNPNLRGRVEVNNYKDLAEVRRRLTSEMKIARNRYSITIKKKVIRDDPDGSDLYIILGTN